MKTFQAFAKERNAKTGRLIAESNDHREIMEEATRYSREHWVVVDVYKNHAWLKRINPQNLRR